MPTDDERREVAARLRDINKWHCYTSRDMLRAIEEACGCNAGESWQDMVELRDRLADLIEPEPESDKREPIRCPNCGASDYAVNYLTSTLIGWTPRYVDGVQVNKDPNKTTKHCTCLLCGSDFEYEVD